jgi:hypothetical protein
VAREIADEAGVVEAARSGPGKALEVIQVVLQTPNWNYSLVREYERLGASRMLALCMNNPAVTQRDRQRRLELGTR